MEEQEQDLKEQKRGILFVDLDTVLMNTNTSKWYAEARGNGNEIRKIYLKYRVRNWEKDEFLQLTDDELVAMFSWNTEWMEFLGRLHMPIDIIFYSKTAFDAQHMELMCRYAGVFRSGFIHCSDRETLNLRIRDMMADREDSSRYVILSRAELEDVHPGHALRVNPLGETDKKEIETMCRRILCTDPKDYFSWFTYEREKDDHDDEIFYKVVFLDIDGVLNDEGKEYDKGIVIDDQKVELLKYIIDRTNAQIILSSSWRYAYRRFVEDGYQSNDKHLIILQEALDKFGIKIAGTTPLSNESGPDARPLEIHEWLRRYNKIFSYVILDDDTFWTWGFLQRNVVTTQTFIPENDEFYQYVKGLTLEHANKAISILNDEGAMIRTI